jgi:integrase
MPHYFDDNELRSILQVAYENDRHVHLALLTALCHGLRVSELLALTPDDLVGGYLRIVAAKDGVVALQPLHKSDNPLFDEARILPAHAHGIRLTDGSRLFPWTRQWLDQVLKAYGALANVHPDKLHMHSLRHSCAMLVFRTTISLGSVKNMLRHKSWAAPLVYLNEMDNSKGIAGRDAALAAIAR